MWKTFYRMVDETAEKDFNINLTGYRVVYER